MPSFGKKSTMKLREIDPRLQKVLNEVIKYIDFTVDCGYRNEEDQNQAVALGHSTKKFPSSKHNRMPSKAVDIIPWPINWKDVARFGLLAGQVIATGRNMGIDIRWGGDWDKDGIIYEHGLVDMPHFEVD